MYESEFPGTPSRYNVAWTTPSRDSGGSMPLGNGRQAANVWLEPSGDICFYLATGDAWGEFGQLYKVGRIRLRVADVEGNPVFGKDLVSWSLNLPAASIEFESSRASARLWVDAHHPCVQFLCKPNGKGIPLQYQAWIERWRDRRHVLVDRERHFLHLRSPYEVFHGPDAFCEPTADSIGWYHLNESSCWRANMSQQGLLEWAEEEGGHDPLLHRIFGGRVSGENWTARDASSLVCAASSDAVGLTVTQLTRCPSSPEAWTASVCEAARGCPAATDRMAWQRHSDWWREFWGRSWIHIEGDEAAYKVSMGYTLQRFLNACAGRGEYPIKFNGSLFTADWHLPGEDFGPDYRRWGPGYWHQNTRLPYWSMLAAGDYEMMRAYFAQYLRVLPLARARCRKFCGHDGAFFTETMTFWGTYLEGDYGWEDEREDGLPGHLPQSRWIRRHNSSGLEVVHHALLFYRYTGDAGFVKETLMPLAQAVLEYYDSRFERRNGKLHIFPAQSIEQWWDATNPMPEVAGLKAVLNALLALPGQFLPQARVKQWTRLQRELPDLPQGETDGQTRFLPAASWEGPPRNLENPELYAVFPYHLCHFACPDLEIGRNSFVARANTHDLGWAQDGMQAALLGLTWEARCSVTKRLSTPGAYARFPAFWGPGFDYLPDQDQGGSATHALQLMLLQCHGEAIHILPAWPADWSVDARLHAPGGRAVHITYRAGEPLPSCEPALPSVVLHPPHFPRNGEVAR